MGDAAPAARVDPVLVEVIRHELTSVAEEMALTMQRTARSLVAREGADFSTALVDGQGRLLAQGLTIGVHLGYVAGVMPRVLEKFGDRLAPGDIIASNDPWSGASHFPDIVLVAPVFHGGERVAFATVVAHHTDIGGRFPGGMGVACAETWEEGIRIPGIRLWEGGAPREEVLEVLAANVRAPEDLLGDLEAQAAACRQGVAGVQAIVDRHGRAVFDEARQALEQYTERLMRAAIRALPDGRYEVGERFEDDGLGGEGVDLRLALEVRGERVLADFSGTAPQVPSAINVPFTLTRACVYVALRSLLGADAPANQGLMTPIDVRAPEGTVLNPRFPAAVGARGMMLWRVIDMVYLALARAAPERVFAAGEGGMNILVFAPEAGAGRGHGILVDIYASGWGGRSSGDGPEGVTPLAAGGATRALTAEGMEAEAPVALVGFGFEPDTGGAGRFRGALSVYRSWRFLAPGRIMLRTCRVDTLPWGLAGGGSGTPYRAVLRRSTGEEVTLPRRMVVEWPVQAGDTLVHVQPGAGGYGDPLERDPERVLADVRAEKLSPRMARRLYGVVLREDGQGGIVLDEAATARARRGARRSACGEEGAGTAGPSASEPPRSR